MSKRKKTTNGASRRRRPEGGKRLAVHLPHDTVRRLRLQCVEEDCSVSDAVTRAVEGWLGERIGK
jgi:hypothetical protein